MDENMTYMVIETFRPGKAKEIYKRLEEKGRMQPRGVTYINSWIDSNLETCYQVMEPESMEKLQEWMDNWDDLMQFKVIPVLSSDEAKKMALHSQLNN